MANSNSKSVSTGKSPVNGGINFQNRVAAWLLICLFRNHHVGGELENNLCPIPQEMAFETADQIDDIKVCCDNNVTIYYQAKRTVVLSDKEASSLVKALDQFVRQYIAAPSPDSYYVLATSNSSSKRITKDLKGILKAIRLNDSNYSNNPWNDDQAHVLAQFQIIIEGLFRKHTSMAPSRQTFVDFCKHIYINAYEIESGGQQEDRAIERLKDGASKEPKDIWNELITSAIDFSTNRLSINRQGIINVLKQSYSGVSIADNPTVRAVSDLNDPDPKKRALAIESLENLQATEQLKTALNHPYSDVRIKAALIVAKLSKYQEQAAVPTLAEALINPDKSTRIEAIVAIGRYALSDSVEIIDRLTKIAAAEDELNTSYEKPERLNALLALSQLKSPQAIQKLGEIALCRGDYPQIRLCAVIALSNTSHQDIIPFLIRIIQHKQLAKELYEIEPKSATYGIARQIKSAAARGLEPFDTVDAKKAIEEWKKSSSA